MADFIDDGFTLTRHYESRPGVYAAGSVTYRPGLRRDRINHGQLFPGGDPARADAAKVDQFEAALIERHVADLNGNKIQPGRARLLHPELHRLLIDLILGYEPADPPASSDVEGALGNSRTG